MRLLEDTRVSYALIGALIVPCFGRLALSGTGREGELYRYLVPLFVGAMSGFLIGRMKRRWLEKVAEIRRLLERSPYSMVVFEGEEVTYLNRKFTELFGHTMEDIQDLAEWLRSAVPDPARRDLIHRLWTTASNGGACDEEDPPIELEVICVDGTTRWVESQMVPIRGSTLVIFKDLTERRRQQEFLVQSEKLVTMGRIAAGIAHEINSPLTGIVQNTSVIAERLAAGRRANEVAAMAAGTTVEAIAEYCQARRIPELLAGVRDSGSRAVKIVKNMLGFARKSELSIGPLPLAALVDEAIELASSDYDLKKRYDFRNIELRRDYHDVPRVLGDRVMLQQVVLNILRNGAEAMAGHRGDKGSRFTLCIAAGEGVVRLEIEDNGPGLDEEALTHAFEPFFTTKPTGTGLGLSIARFIVVEVHGGSLDVYTTPGGGCRFIIDLPSEEPHIDQGSHHR